MSVQELLSTKRLTDTSLINDVFGKDLVLLDSVNELFELELAFHESKSLNHEELIRRSAFFKSANGALTNHYRLCKPFDAPLSENRSAQTQAYFQEGKYSTGYATHGLFPYRGKFHPQLIKGLLNILSIKEGETVLDPMCGSGTLNVEASLLGINSIAVDISPFCRLMTRVKCQSLSLSPKLVKAMPRRADKWFSYFSSGELSGKLKRIKDSEKLKIYDLALLAYLDAMGYARRVTKSNHRELFEKVLQRYQNTVLHTIMNPIVRESQLGNVQVLEGEARSLPISDSCVDSVITSPPYSFAIDYAENDAPQLKFLGYDVDQLRTQMLGLAGRTKSEKLHRYFNDMKIVVSEIVRVLKPQKFAIMIIGSNTNQTGGIRLERTIIGHFEQAEAPLVRSIVKPIKGMRNTMKDEFILFFQKK
jgi:DNA modification methylase